MNKRLVAGLALVALAAVAGVIVQRTSAPRPTIRPADGPASRALGTAAVKPATPAAPAAPSEDSDAAPAHRPIPEDLPTFTLNDRDGIPRELSHWKGHPLIVNFWATWCGPCREEIPLLKTLRNQRANDRLEIVGIAIDSKDDVLKYAREIGIDYPILIGEQEGYAAAESFGVSLVLPFSVFADRQGRILTLKVGELHANEAEFILDRVRDVDANRLELAAARQQIADRLRDFAVERGKQAASTG